MGQERHTLPGYDRVVPYRQGMLSSFCGIYAAINAARLVLPDHATHRTLWSDVYGHAVSWLGTRRRLKHGLLQGLSFDCWKELQHALYDEVSERLGMSLRMRPLVRRGSTLQDDPAAHIRKAIDTGRAVLCALSGELDHYTVIAGYTSTRWLLHDSYGYRWVDRRGTAIGSPQGKRHWIAWPSLVVLTCAQVSS